MKFLIFILVITSVVFLQSTDAYHPEREVTLEKSQRTGIFNSMMDRITFPVVGESYHLQVVLRDPRRSVSHGPTDASHGASPAGHLTMLIALHACRPEAVVVPRDVVEPGSFLTRRIRKG